MTLTPNQPTDFRRFEVLTRRILITLKAELLKPADAKRIVARKAGKTKG